MKATEFLFMLCGFMGVGLCGCETLDCNISRRDSENAFLAAHNATKACLERKSAGDCEKEYTTELVMQAGFLEVLSTETQCKNAAAVAAEKELFRKEQEAQVGAARSKETDVCSAPVREEK